MRTVVSADPVDSTVSLAEGEAGRDASDAELLRLVAGGSEAAFVALWESDHAGGECQLGKRHSFQPRTSRVRGVCSPCKERVGMLLCLSSRCWVGARGVGRGCGRGSA